jgi:streptogramin lyase
VSRRNTFVAGLLLLGCVWSAPCRQAAALPPGNLPLGPGEIVITEFFDDAYRIDPVTGAKTLLDVGTFAPGSGASIAIDAARNVLSIDNSGNLLRFDPVTLGVTQLTTANFFGATDLAIEPSGNILVADDAIFRVDPATGVTTTLTDGSVPNGGFFSPGTIDVGPTGRIFITEFFEDLWEINPVTGVATTVPQSRDLSQPYLIQVRSDGDLVMQEFNTGNIVRINPTTGAITTFATGVPTGTRDLALEANDALLVSADNGVFRVAPGGGAPAILTPDMSFFSPEAIAVAPAPEPAAGLLAALAIACAVTRWRG